MADVTFNGGQPNPTTPVAGGTPNTDIPSNQGNNSGQPQTPIAPQQPGESDIDYKKRYSDSTRENQRIKQEFDTYREENDPYAKVGIAFAERYKSDPEFKEFVDKKYGKSSEGGTGTGTPSNANPTPGTNQPETPEAIWARNKMSEEQRVQSEYYMKLEEGHTETLDKYNTRGANGEIINPVRQAIGTLTRALMRDGLPFEKAAATAFTRIVAPDVAIDEAKLDGLVEGLQSNSLSVIGGTNSKSKVGSETELTGEDVDILRQLGVDPNSDAYKSVVSN